MILRIVAFVNALGFLNTTLKVKYYKSCPLFILSANLYCNHIIPYYFLFVNNF